MVNASGQAIPLIKFQAKLFKIKDWTILLLPKDESKKLPTRAMTMVEGKVNDTPFKAVLEPDGRGSHWFRIDKILKNIDNNLINVEMEPTKDWTKPIIPPDMKHAIVKDREIHRFWNSITPIAQWDWLRWVRAVKSEETRKKHINVMISKLSHGERRPCCFNRNLCSEPYVSKSWILIDPNSAI